MCKSLEKDRKYQTMTRPVVPAQRALGRGPRVRGQAGGRCGFSEGARPPAHPGVVPVNVVRPWALGTVTPRPSAQAPCQAGSQRAVTVIRTACLFLGSCLRGPVQLLLRTHPQGAPVTHRLSGFRCFPVLRLLMLFSSLASGQHYTYPTHSVADRCHSTPLEAASCSTRDPDSEKLVFVERRHAQSSQRSLPTHPHALDLAGQERADLPGVCAGLQLMHPKWNRCLKWESQSTPTVSPDQLGSLANPSSRFSKCLLGA